MTQQDIEHTDKYAIQLSTVGGTLQGIVMHAIIALMVSCIFMNKKNICGMLQYTTLSRGTT